jgi:hypothetical protein
MTNTKFRKRALLSSVAMLLVALVALGSATFAWFAANPNASASGLSLKTTAATGLVIRTETDLNWSHSAAFNAEAQGTSPETYATKTSAFNLTPVSQGQNTVANEAVTGHAGTFYKVDAGTSADYRAGKDATIASTGTSGMANNDAYAEKVYFRLSDGSADGSSKKVKLTGVTINVNANATMGDAIRVAVADPDGKLIGTFANATGGANGVINDTSLSLATAIEGNDKIASYTAGTFNPALEAESTAISKETGITGLTTAEQTSKYVTVYVWLDGQDSNCYSDKVGTVNAATIIDSIQVDFTLVD